MKSISNELFCLAYKAEANGFLNNSMSIVDLFQFMFSLENSEVQGNLIEQKELFFLFSH